MDNETIYVDYYTDQDLETKKIEINIEGIYLRDDCLNNIDHRLNESAINYIKEEIGKSNEI